MRFVDDDICEVVLRELSEALRLRKRLYRADCYGNIAAQATAFSLFQYRVEPAGVLEFICRLIEQLTAMRHN